MSAGEAAGRESFDAIVIGSGLGGLATAAYLCASGRRTLITAYFEIRNSSIYCV